MNPAVASNGGIASSSSGGGSSSSGSSGVGGTGSGGRQEVRLLSREINALVTVSNPGPRFSALPTFSDSEEDAGVGSGGVGGLEGGRKKRRHRGAAVAGATVAAVSVSAVTVSGGSSAHQLLQLQQLQQQQPASTNEDSLYDAQGRIAANGQDACDCLTLGCPGCYYPCGKCGSAKCGYECRVGRSGYVKSVTVEGVSELVIRNRLIAISDDDEDD